MIVTIKMLWMCVSTRWRSNCRENPVRSDTERIMLSKKQHVYVHEYVHVHVSVHVSVHTHVYV